MGKKLLSDSGILLHAANAYAFATINDLYSSSLIQSTDRS